ncbi:MAG: apolipoprotein N-acyltransferase [Acidimicrobiales bacterium]
MRRPVLLAVLGGLAAAASVQPVGLWPLGIAGAGLLALAWSLASSRSARSVAGGAWALSMLACTTLWVIDFSAVGYVVLALLGTSFFAAAGAVVPVGGRWAGLGAAGAITVAEALRARIPFEGFPMGGLPQGQAAGPLGPTARLGGTTLVTLATALAGAALVEAVRRRPVRAVALLVLPVLAAGLGGLAPAGTPIGSLRVAVVQGGGPRGTRGVETAARDVLDRHLAASRTIEPGTADVVLWPENAVSLPGPTAESPEGDELAAEARRLGAVLLVGVVEDLPPDRFRNAQVAFAPDGQLVGRYDKVHRVPFGEYAPLRALVAKLVDLSLLPRDAVRGQGAGILPGPQGQRLGVVISYEVFFGDRSRAAIGDGGQVLLVPTNAASYATSQVPDQEVAAARLRAWETGRDVVQAAPTGFSAFVAPDGAVSQRTDLGAQQVITAVVPLRRGTTPYLRTGDRPWLLLTLAALGAPGLAGLLGRRAGRGREQPADPATT